MGNEIQNCCYVRENKIQLVYKKNTDGLEMINNFKSKKISLILSRETASI